MIISTNINTSIKVVLNAAMTTANMQIVATWADLPSANFESGQTQTVSNGVTEVEVVPAILNNKRRHLNYLSVYNSDTAAKVVTVFVDVSGTNYILQSVSLPVGFTLIYNVESGWAVYNTSGAQVTSTSTSLADGTYGDIAVSSSGTVWTLIASISKAITGVWSFVSDNLRLYNAAQSFYHEFVSLASANKTATFPDKDITVAGIDDVYVTFPQHVTSGSFADSRTYYAGIGGLQLLTVDTAADTPCPFDCTVVGLIIYASNNTTSGTSENCTAKMHITGGASSASFGNFQTNASTTNGLGFYLTGTTFDINAGDLYSCEIETPAWATNPIGCAIRITPVVKRR